MCIARCPCRLLWERFTGEFQYSLLDILNLLQQTAVCLPVAVAGEVIDYKRDKNAAKRCKLRNIVDWCSGPVARMPQTSPPWSWTVCRYLTLPDAFWIFGSFWILLDLFASNIFQPFLTFFAHFADETGWRACSLRVCPAIWTRAEGHWNLVIQAEIIWDNINTD